MCCLILVIVVAGVFLSYSVSKEQAEEVAQRHQGSVSPLKGQLVLFIGDDFSPCWVFRGEYEDALTGATFDVYVSVFGRIIRAPSKGQLGVQPLN